MNDEKVDINTTRYNNFIDEIFYWYLHEHIKIK